MELVRDSIHASRGESENSQVFYGEKWCTFSGCSYTPTFTNMWCPEFNFEARSKSKVITGYLKRRFYREVHTSVINMCIIRLDYAIVALVVLIFLLC